MKSWNGYSVTDPSILESRFSDDDGLAYADSVFSEMGEDDSAQMDRVKSVVEQLPPREADFVDLYYFKRLKQTEIASIFGVSQPTVCYRLSRAADRIRFLLNTPAMDDSIMTNDLSGFLSDPLDVQIMILMWKTTCQSEVAKRLGVSQGLVRHRFLRSLSRMRPNIKFAKHVAVFDCVFSNLNIMREVQRADFDDHIIHCVF